MTTTSDTTERPRPSKSQRTRQTILEAAEDLFSERGYDATSLDEIGRHAGIRGSAILYHYATKRELYEAVLDRIFGPFIDEAYGLLDREDPLDDRLVAIASAMVRFAARRPSAARLLLREASAGSVHARDIVAQASAPHWQRLFEVLTSERDEQVETDPLLAWDIVVGAICFHFSAGPTVGGSTGDPSAPDRVDAFDEVIRHLTRSLFSSGAIEDQPPPEPAIRVRTA